MCTQFFLGHLSVGQRNKQQKLHMAMWGKTNMSRSQLPTISCFKPRDSSQLKKKERELRLQALPQVAGDKFFQTSLAKHDQPEVMFFVREDDFRILEIVSDMMSLGFN